MEESGSEGLDDLVFSRKDTFFKDVDYVCISDNYWLGKTKPCITYGLRGICYFFLEVRKRSFSTHEYETFYFVQLHPYKGYFILVQLLNRWNAATWICILECLEAPSMKPWLTWLLSWVSEKSHNVQKRLHNKADYISSTILSDIPETKLGKRK